MIRLKNSILLLFFFPLAGITQNFTFTEGDLVEKTILQSEFEFAETKIHNLSDAAVIYEWEMITFDNPVGWDFSICDYTVCYTGGETTGTMTSVPAGSETAFIRANVYANSAGVGTYRFVVWDQAIPSDKDTVTFIVTVEDEGASLAEELSADNLNAFTTSANQIILSNSGNHVASYSVYNVSGQITLSGRINGAEKTILEASSLTTGIYFVQFKANNKAIRTVKVMVR